MAAISCLCMVLPLDTEEQPLDQAWVGVDETHRDFKDVSGGPRVCREIDDLAVQKRYLALQRRNVNQFYGNAHAPFDSLFRRDPDPLEAQIYQTRKQIPGVVTHCLQHH